MGKGHGADLPDPVRDRGPTEEVVDEASGGTSPITLVSWYCSPADKGAEFWLRTTMNGGALWPDLGLTGPEAAALGDGAFEAWSELPQAALDAGYFVRVELT